jgi:hypothetical protein
MFTEYSKHYFLVLLPNSPYRDLLASSYNKRKAKDRIFDIFVWFSTGLQQPVYNICSTIWHAWYVPIYDILFFPINLNVLTIIFTMSFDFSISSGHLRPGALDRCIKSIERLLNYQMNWLTLSGFAHHRCYCSGVHNQSCWSFNSFCSREQNPCRRFSFPISFVVIIVNIKSLI